MYPLKVILIGSNEHSLPQVRRELLNRSAQLEGEFPNAGSAIDALKKSSSEKRLLMLHMGSASELEGLSRLTSLLPGWPVVALIEGYDPKSSLGEVVIGVMRAGATQIVALPIRSEDFGEALDRISIQYVYSVKDTKVIAVAGATGGAGATSVALNLAFEVADRHGLRCVLVDLSLHLGVIASHLNIEPANTIIDLLHDTSRVDSNFAQQALIRVADNFELLAGPQKLVGPSSFSTDDVAHVVDTLRLIADVVVLDVPCTYDDIYFDTLAAANHAILIGEQKLPSIRALKMVREAINRSSGSEHVVINRFDPKNKGFEVRRLLKPLGISTLHTVARDELGMYMAMEKACTLRLAASRSPALVDIVALADQVLALETPSRIKPVGLLGRLGRALVNS